MAKYIVVDEKNRIDLFFDNVPSKNILEKMRASEFHYVKHAKKWQSFYSEHNLEFAKEICRIDNEAVAVNDIACHMDGERCPVCEVGEFRFDELWNTYICTGCGCEWNSKEVDEAYDRIYKEEQHEERYVNWYINQDCNWKSFGYSGGLVRGKK